MVHSVKDKVLLIILDGYGEGKDYPGNAVTRSKTPFLNSIRKTYPKSLLKADGNAVGLPRNSMGGSEVGHYTIGAGRRVTQTLEEINQSIRDGSFFKKKPLIQAMNICKKKKSNLHLVGMISDTGIHSDIRHLYALLKMSKSHLSTVNKIFIHAITDGRDVAEKSALKYLKQIQREIKKLGVGEIASIIGRYYAMDRDKNWNRTKKAYDLMVNGKGHEEKNTTTAIRNAYERGDETDYYLEPMILNTRGTIKKNDAVIFWNFRTDRARQLTQKFIESKFSVTCFGEYAKKASIVFPETKKTNNLGKTLAKEGKRQMRIAETDKYPHVTYFFNSQRLEPYEGEDRKLVPSLKCPSYAEKPEMNAAGITREGIKAIQKGVYDFILINYANPDLVGHSGRLAAVKKAMKFLDTCLARVIPAAQKAGYHIVLTSDHGNAEEMTYSDGSPKPSHTLNRVPCWIISPEYKVKKRYGELCRIAPTVLTMMNLKKPKEMTCASMV